MDNPFGVTPVESVEDLGQGEEQGTQEQDSQETKDSELDSPEEAGQENSEEGEESQQDTQQQEQEQQQEQHKLILGKFKSQEDLERAYQNLESVHTRTRQDLARFQQQPQAPKQEQPDMEEAQLVAWYNETVKTDPAQANAVLANYMAQKTIDQRMAQITQDINPILDERRTNQIITTTASRYQDFYNYTDAMTQEIQEMVSTDPSLKSSPMIYEMAYWRAKSKALETNAKTAFENGKKAAEENRSAKKKVTNEAGKSSKQQQTDTIPEGLTILPEGDGIFL